MTEELKPFLFEVSRQGAVDVNTGHIHAESPDIVCAYIDLRSKYAEVCCIGSDSGGLSSVTLGANDHTLYLHEGLSSDELTELSFPAYRGWNVFCAHVARYTLSVCLVKGSR